MKHHPKKLNLKEQIQIIQALLTNLQEFDLQEEKLQYLNNLSQVKEFFLQPSPLEHIFQNLNIEQDYVVKSVIAIGQGNTVFSLSPNVKDMDARFQTMIDNLLMVEKFYSVIGGIIGYHLNVLQLFEAHHYKVDTLPENVKYLKPEGINLAEDTPEVRKAVRMGIELMDQVAEMYPLGGAGDRLNLIDEETKRPLPAAVLNYGGRTLFEDLIRDLQAREYIHFKFTGKQLTIPIAAMTSPEKNNHHDIIEIAEKNNWFARSPESFRFFMQPLAPVITKDGHWSLSAPLSLTLKPGGHGVIWLLAAKEGIYEWFASLGRRKALLRQINNPMAGIDLGLLALSGIGCGNQKVFGFATCDRLVEAAEGMDILLEKKVGDAYEYAISNIEYNEFHKKGIKDEPFEPGGLISAFPANTNILFADLDAIQEVLKECPLPGKLINLKQPFPYMDPQKGVCHVEGSRLETMMQNISDHFVEKSSHHLTKNEMLKLKTFVTYNKRRKTISVTKKKFEKGGAILETPEGAFYDHLLNIHELFVENCKFAMPILGTDQLSVQKYIMDGPPFIIWLNPALGPLYSVIGQKIRAGKIEQKAEMILEIADLDIENLSLKGSLIILADNIMGKSDSNGVLKYGDHSGKCELHHVKVVNRGVDYSAQNCYWKNDARHQECLRIHLEGNAEFYAKDVIFEGHYEILVPSGYRMTAFMEMGKVSFRKEEIKGATWSWHYRFDQNDNVILSKKSSR